MEGEPCHEGMGCCEDGLSEVGQRGLGVVKYERSLGKCDGYPSVSEETV